MACPTYRAGFMTLDGYPSSEPHHFLAFRDFFVLEYARLNSTLPSIQETFLESFRSAPKFHACSETAFRLSNLSKVAYCSSYVTTSVRARSSQGPQPAYELVTQSGYKTRFWKNRSQIATSPSANQRASTIITDAENKADAMKKLEENAESFQMPVTVD
ncbi:hypothetical protein BGZ60DRAFT_437032 [Tricladium varicosporioides]|nr:hypothetical protein BGZ60DRAFT_437032 [Hymenoscyphus varicosporioides]